MPYMTLSKGSDSIEIAPYIEEINWSENDLDDPDAGRTLDGLMHRGKVTSKRRADIKLINVSAATANSIFQILRNEYFYCSTDLMPGDDALYIEMYNSTRKGGIQIITTDNLILHKDVSFNIIER